VHNAGHNAGTTSMASSGEHQLAESESESDLESESYLGSGSESESDSDSESDSSSKASPHVPYPDKRISAPLGKVVPTTRHVQWFTNAFHWVEQNGQKDGIYRQSPSYTTLQDLVNAAIGAFQGGSNAPPTNVAGFDAYA